MLRWFLCATELALVGPAKTLPKVDEPDHDEQPASSERSTLIDDEAAPPAASEPSSPRNKTQDEAIVDPSAASDTAPQDPRAADAPRAVPNRQRPSDDVLFAPTPGKRPPKAEAIARDSDLDVQPTAKRKGLGKRNRQGTPQNFAFEFKLGPYLPDVDKNYDGPGFGPYASIYGRTNDVGETIKAPRPGIMPAIEFDWQIVYLAGPLGIGVQVGFFGDKAKALIAEPVDPGESVRSEADETKFRAMPFSLLAVYRFELLADFYKIPIAPYAKAGLSYAFWWSKNGNGDIAKNKAGQKGRGGSWGWQISAGAMLRLDFLEPATAKKFDISTGINHSYLFAEYQFSRIDDFGTGNGMSLGDSTFFAGLGIEF